MTAPNQTNASALVSYRLELIEGGFEPNMAAQMARDAAVELIRGGAMAVRMVEVKP